MIFLCKAGDIPLNGCKRHSRGRHPAMLLFNLDGRYYATDDSCTHGRASLSTGHIEDGQIFCPLHLGSFDITTGQPVEPPCDEPLKTYRLHLRDGGLYVETEA